MAPIERIEYSTDQQDWTDNGGGSEYSFEYAEEGETTLYYRAVDELNNIEEPNTEVIRIDTRKPVVNISIERPKLTRVDEFVVDFDISDPMPGSGIDSVTAFLDGAVVSDDQTIDLLWFALGQHELEVTATDVAGWFASANDGPAGFEPPVRSLPSGHERAEKTPPRR